uniref:Reverse transcriptase domain-containing protein n=1 Tax=Tanacetum cinerariifolium TaxID=118510 RepID=A0A699SJC6_TANCI|nr:reverse transcriptase domain-containing protein [Tanacetum cinerariifolium]
MKEMEMEELEMEEMEIEEMEMIMEMEEDIAITLEDLCLLDSNYHKRMIRIEAAYAMSWTELMKLMTEVYYLRNEIQKMETELWNLAVKGNDLTAYTRRF